MPWIRFKRWRYLTPLAPRVAVCSSGRRYLWDGSGDGAAAVASAKDVEELLNPPSDLPSDYEVAWERYGVCFDANGCELAESQAEAEAETKTTAESDTVRIGKIRRRR